MRILTIDRTKCNGCGACQAICSINKKQAVKPDEARIRLRRTAGIETQYVAYCQHCAEPVCTTACLKGIIDKDPVTGIVSRDFEYCFECAACSVLCPMEAVVYDSSLKAYVTCDFCGEDPLCVKVCPTGALAFEEPSQASVEKRGKHGRRIFAKESGEVQP